MAKKYIDAEKLKNEIKRQADLYQDTFVDDMRDKLIDFIDACMSDIVPKRKTMEDSLQQEQPNKESLNESQQEFVNIVTERMLKEGPIPTLKGKQKAEFEKEFNRFKQIAGMVNWPAYEEIYKKIILWFMAWGADNFPNLNKVTDPYELDFQQEQPNDVCAEIKEYYGEDLAFDDERAKAAYHFFSAGKAFELREYEEERKKHITDLLNNFQKGMNAGYEKAISELKEGKVECSPVMKELIDKLLGIGNTFNFGFGPKNIQLEQSKVDLEKEIKNYLATECEPSVSKTARHFFNLGLNAIKEDET